MASTESRRELLEKLVNDLDSDLTQALKFFTEIPFAFDANWVVSRGRESVTLHLKGAEGLFGIVPLSSRGEKVLGLAPRYSCELDSSGRFLSVATSSLALYPFARLTSEPLFRVEFVRDQQSELPSAHFHVHAHRDEFTHLMGFASKLNADNPRVVKKYLRGTTRLAEFHFPTGGRRFRPCLEDVLEALRVEFNLDVDNAAWQEHLREARAKWRRVQLSAAIHDDPEEALRVLVEDLGMPAPSGWQPPATDLDKLTRS